MMITIVQRAAHVALPASTSIGEADERVHIGAAATAALNANRTEGDHWDLSLDVRRRRRGYALRCHGTDHSSEGHSGHALQRGAIGSDLVAELHVLFIRLAIWVDRRRSGRGGVIACRSTHVTGCCSRGVCSGLVRVEGRLGRISRSSHSILISICRHLVSASGM